MRNKNMKDIKNQTLTIFFSLVFIEIQELSLDNNKKRSGSKKKDPKRIHLLWGLSQKKKARSFEREIASCKDEECEKSYRRSNRSNWVRI